MQMCECDNEKKFPTLSEEEFPNSGIFENLNVTLKCSSANSIEVLVWKFLIAIFCTIFFHFSYFYDRRRFRGII